VYPRRSAANSLLFLERMIEEMPFPVQVIQTDRGREFFAYCFQEKLMQYAIKFRRSSRLRRTSMEKWNAPSALILDNTPGALREALPSRLIEFRNVSLL
jgi:hypothetical protein